jgi:steroid delta-isomerase-like uncharacterized protein
MTDAEALIRSYYEAFNAGERERMLSLLTEDVAHGINQGGREVGREAFREFLRRMDAAYREEATELVVLTAPGGTRAAAEFTILGAYLATQPGLPEARGQAYRLPVGAFFEIRDARIARVTTYYDLPDWIRQVSR